MYLIARTLGPYTTSMAGTSRDILGNPSHSCCVLGQSVAVLDHPDKYVDKSFVRM